ncbi:acyl-CoA dehydrogenase family protein [Rhodococcus sp. NPDC127528]|uniref:acyl-CoA dehydrogenase family protein n=1 Tax=unclassified Rhodococcus (in: high G+C Gram-positive bacteria) TaxID=192944 RepID=UPI00362B7A09
MDFDLSDEQQMLAEATRDLLARSDDPEGRARAVAGELGWSRAVWKCLAAMGLLGLTFAEEDGGMDAGPVEAMVVMTEIGRRLAPEPLVDAVLLPGGLVAAVGTAHQRRGILPDLAAGEALLAFAHHEPGRRWPDTTVATAATRSGTGWTVTGTKHPVLHGDCAQRLIVSAALPDGGIGLFVVGADAEGVARTGYRTHDHRRGAQIELSAAPAEPLGEPIDRSAEIEAAEVRTQALLCAEAVGAMDEALRLTVEYLKTRKQFGVPLARFQALTHRAADMYVALELARSMSLYLTMSLAAGTADAIVASRARLRVARSARLIGQQAIQMHGGIGLTVEYPVGHYANRLTAIEHTLGGRDDHLRRLSGRVRDHRMVVIQP